jgi:hypothetical protein
MRAALAANSLELVSMVESIGKAIPGGPFYAAMPRSERAVRKEPVGKSPAAERRAATGVAVETEKFGHEGTQKEHR